MAGMAKLVLAAEVTGRLAGPVPGLVRAGRGRGSMRGFPGWRRLFAVRWARVPACARLRDPGWGVPWLW
jgi:hypothetical protein